MSSTRRLPFGLSIEGSLEWGYRVILFFCVIGLIYLRSIFATNEALGATDKKVADLVAVQSAILPRVAQNEARGQSQWSALKEQQAALTELKSEISAIRATQVEAVRNTEKNFDRLFSKLDAR